MRILVDGIPKGIGGIGTLIINLVNYNEQIGKKDSIIFEFLVPKQSEYINFFEDKGYKYYEVPRVLRWSYRKCIDKIFAQNKYDYVWINNTSKINIYLPQKAKKSHAVVMMHSHGVQSEEIGIKKILFNLIENFQKNSYCKLIDIPFACSNASAEYFYPEELMKECKIISNGIDTDRFLFDEKYRIEIRDSLSIDIKDVLLGASGRLTKVKNYGFLIKLMTLLPPNFKLIILGDGEEKDEYKKLIYTLELENRVFLIGKKDCVEKYLCAMDIFLMPSLNEGLPFSLVEAQANGLKCIVSTGVSEEAKLINTTSFLPLEDEGKWRDEILAYTSRGKERRLYNEQVIYAGYSIKYSYETFISSILKFAK